MRVIFLGGLFPDEMRNEISSKSIGVIQNAADVLQRNIVNGLSQFCNISIINLVFVGSFPFRYKSKSIKSFQVKSNISLPFYNVGFSNIMIFKHISRFLCARRALMEIVNNEFDFILVYSIHTPFVRAALDVKNRNPNVKVCLIVPDLPEYFSQSTNVFYVFAKKIEKFFLNRMLEKVDSFIVLTDSMVPALKVGSRNWLRLEGIFNEVEDSSVEPKEVNKSILYSGTLDKSYGILHLLEAFSKVTDSEYRLWICGEGNAKRDVLDAMRCDERIVYFGQLPRNEVLKMQKRATVLVNPRLPIASFTKFSFPSKVIEYLASGTPVVMYRLEGIPEEYYEFISTPVDLTSGALKNVLINVCEFEISKYMKISEDARKFIFDNKNSIVQCEKLYFFLKNQL
jgi:glycosyltransferase involved in cell wall biosynthesis